MLRARINHSLWWWAGGICCHSLSWDGWSGKNTDLMHLFLVQHSIFFFMLQSLAQRFKKKNNQKNAQLVLRIKVSQLAVECTARPAVNNKKQKKQLCNVFRGSDGRFGCHLDYLFIFQTSAFSSRGASDNDVSDWVTFEYSVFKPYWLWGIQVGVIQVHGLLIERINFTARCVCSAMQRWCRKSLSCIPHLLKRYIKFPQVS